jgi:hypothetical protein
LVRVINPVTQRWCPKTPYIRKLRWIPSAAGSLSEVLTNCVKHFHPTREPVNKSFPQQQQQRRHDYSAIQSHLHARPFRGDLSSIKRWYNNFRSTSSSFLSLILSYSAKRKYSYTHKHVRTNVLTCVRVLRTRSQPT